MSRADNAGQRPDPSMLVDVEALVSAYHDRVPDPSDPAQRVSFGTSGHRGSAFDTTFNEAHILAVSQAVCDHRRGEGIDGPLFLGRDTHALSAPAMRTAIEVFVANGVEVLVDADDGYTPTPALSHAILTHNRGGADQLADGVVITPSHNPPEDGGFKYNPPNGGPADASITDRIEEHANALLADGLSGVARMDPDEARAACRAYDYVSRYVDDLATVIDLDAIREAGVRIGADPMGGASVDYYRAIAERHGLDLTVTNPEVDPTFAFMRLDWDGRIRMDCSSPDAMQGLIELKDRFDVAVANDTDADRHGIVTPAGGLMNPNHYLAVAIDYLLTHRPDWPLDAGIGKTLVSSSIIDRVVAGHDRDLVEVPVGFKWFVSGLLDASVAFGGEESAGAAFLRHDGTVWTTDKDGILLTLLAAEIIARTGQDPSKHYERLTAEHGAPVYRRIDAPANAEQKAALKQLSADDLDLDELAGEPITATMTRAPGNNAPIGGLKVVTAQGWFAARPSGTEDVYKIYAESFLGEDHLDRILEQAQQVVSSAWGA